MTETVTRPRLCDRDDCAICMSRDAMQEAAARRAGVTGYDEYRVGAESRLAGEAVDYYSIPSVDTDKIRLPVPRIYLAGPMRGLPNFNYEAFHAAAADLRSIGLEVFNPAEAFDGDQSRPAEDYLKLDLDYIVNQATEVYVLPNWEGSAGVRAEVTVARAIGLPVIDYETRRDLDVTDLPVDMEAAAIVYGTRQASYGHPREDFARTGKMWAAILGLDEVTPAQVGLCMAALKISREVNKPKKDNITDLIGYAITVARVEDMQP